MNIPQTEGYVVNPGVTSDNPFIPNAIEIHTGGGYSIFMTVRLEIDPGM